MSERERHLRSRLAQLVTQAALVRGNISVREKVCGKANCHCASGDKHRSVYLVASEGGKVRQLFIPASMEQQATEYTETYKRIIGLLEELSQIYRERLRKREL